MNLKPKNRLFYALVSFSPKEPTVGTFKNE
jgi:hypothetical protein